MTSEHRKSAVSQCEPNQVQGVRQGMCGTCAFVDPTAWEDDPELLAKIFHCVETGTPFTCHDNMPHDAQGHFQPHRLTEGPHKGQIDLSQLKLCAGFESARRLLLARQRARDAGVIPDKARQFKRRQQVALVPAAAFSPFPRLRYPVRSRTHDVDLPSLPVHLNGEGFERLVLPAERTPAEGE